MVLDFTKGKYKLQLFFLLFIVLISGLIFQLLGFLIVGATTSLDLFSITENNYYEPILKHKQGFWILFTLMFFNSLGTFILPSILFSKLISENPTQYLSINLKKSLNFTPLLPIFILAGVFIVGFLGEINMKINLPEMFHNMEDEANKLITYITSFKRTEYIISTVLLMAVMPAIGEELIFRGIIQKILVKWSKSNWVGVLITAFIFSAIHFQFLTFLPRFFMGIVLGYLFIWSKNLLIPIIAHFLHNFISIIFGLVYLVDESKETESINIWLVLLSTAIMFTIGYRYYILSKKHYV